MVAWPLNDAVSKSRSLAGLPLPVIWPSAPPVDCSRLAFSLALGPCGHCAFFRADMYLGSFYGWIFKTDALGLGYYLDVTLLPCKNNVVPNIDQRHASYLRLCEGHPELKRPFHPEHVHGSGVWS